MEVTAYRERMMADLDYDPETGHFIWKITSNAHGGKIMPGDIAGGRTQGYVQICRKGKCVRAHRLAYLFVNGEWPPEGMDIDHINGNREDNRWVNLRLATRSQNNNNGGIRADNKSGHRGVSFATREQKWDARIKVNGKLYLLGKFKDKEDAIAARKKAEKDLCPDWTPALDRKARLRNT